MSLSRTSLFSIFLLVVTASASLGATLGGRISDPDGRGVAGARVIVAGRLGTIAEGTTDASGAYEIVRLPAGQYDVRIVADGLQANPQTVMIPDTGRSELNLQLRLAAISESIVVSASQVDVPLSRAPGSVSIITAADLASEQAETVADALRLAPDMAVTRSGDRGSLTSLFPRGGNSNYTLVLVDGIAMNSFGGGFDFGHLSVGDIDHIEIIRGPQSALYGSNAIGAVVQIVTKRGGRPRLEGSAEGGSQSTSREAVDAAGSTGAWTFGLGAEHYQTDGYTGIAPATGERVTNDDDHATHASGSVGWGRPDGPDVLVTGNISRDERGNPGAFGSNLIGAFTAVDRLSRTVNNTRQIGARISHPWSSTVRQRIDANYFDLSSDFTGSFGPSSSGTRRFDGRIQEDIALASAFGASGGVELVRERGTNSFVTGASNNPIPIERAVVGTFGELRYSRPRLLAAAGLRLEHITRDSVEADPSGFLPRPAFPSQTVNSLNPKLAASYLLTDPQNSHQSTRLHASAGTGIRPPDAFEIAFTDNPGLKPERTTSVDGGIEQVFAGGMYLVGATAFFNRYDDLIVTVGTSFQGASQYHTDNISNARARGVELTGALRPLAHLALRGNYTFLDTELLAVDGFTDVVPISASIVPLRRPFQVGDPLLRRPRHQGSVNITYAVGRVSAFGEVTSRGQVLDVEPSFGSSGGVFFSSGYTVANAGASVRISRGLELYARVLNIADRAYEEALGFPALRRSVIAGIRVAASR